MSNSESEDEQLNELKQRDSDWEDWADDDGEAEGDTTQSLFDSTLLPNPEAAFEYDAAKHGFDIRTFKIQRGLDEYDTMKVINFIRREVAAGNNPIPSLTDTLTPAAPSGGTPDTSSTPAQSPWLCDSLLTPVQADDPLLTYDYDEKWQQGCATAVSPHSTPCMPTSAGDTSSSEDPAAVISALSTQLASARTDNRELLLRVAALMEVALPPDVQQELREAATSGQQHLLPEGASSSRLDGVRPAAITPTGPGGTTTCHAVTGVVGKAGTSLARQVDAAYFDSYSYFDIHHEMLSDKPRTAAYQSALTCNPSLVGGATVLDVGCGTSILSLFAAKGGAAAVVGLDGSERIAGFARKVAAANGLDTASGGPVSILSGKVEEVADIGHKQVSIIVSEWMGYALLFESMLDSVLTARNKWLAPGGAVLPDRASIWVAGADSDAFGTGFWQDVYGFDMSPIGADISTSAAAEPKVLVRPVQESCIITNSCQVHNMDLMTMTADQQDFTASFDLEPLAGGSAGAASNSTTALAAIDTISMAAVVLWFDVEFSERFCKECPVTLSTSPSAQLTHWVQAVLPLQQPIQLAAKNSNNSSGTLPSKAQCRISMARSRSKHRCLDISLEVSAGGSAPQARVYSMQVTAAEV